MRAWIVLMLMLPLAAAAQTPGFGDSHGEQASRAQTPVPLPPYPEPKNYLPFQVSDILPFAFFVDAKSISVSADGVVRYSLIAKSSDGALNISYEGMRCSDGQFRVYAFGRPDKTWFEVRDPKWQVIRKNPSNAQRAVLYNDFFCPVIGGAIATAEEGVRALKNGGNQRATITSY
jgi:CNP1-like family